MRWTDERPRSSGIYWYMDDLATIAEDISIVTVDLEAGDGGEVGYHGLPARPLAEHRGLWLGPVPAAGGSVPTAVAARVAPGTHASCAHAPRTHAPRTHGKGDA
jgi:hypothetical protein